MQTGGVIGRIPMKKIVLHQAGELSDSECSDRKSTSCIARNVRPTSPLDEQIAIKVSRTAFEYWKVCVDEMEPTANQMLQLALIRSLRVLEREKSASSAAALR